MVTNLSERLNYVCVYVNKLLDILFSQDIMLFTIFEVILRFGIQSQDLIYRAINLIFLYTLYTKLLNCISYSNI